jgi:hypothetical protein
MAVFVPRLRSNQGSAFSVHLNRSRALQLKSNQERFEKRQGRIVQFPITTENLRPAVSNQWWRTGPPICPERNHRGKLAK